jgi:hypothetical protein
MTPRSARAYRATSSNRASGGTQDPQAQLVELAKLADFLDTRYGIPGTRLRFGIDAILGLVPGIGDSLAALPALYLIWRARQLGVPKGLLLRMIANVSCGSAAPPAVENLRQILHGFKGTPAGGWAIFPTSRRTASLGSRVSASSVIT